MSDLDIRVQALDPARSILLQAPAGSGKTTVLAQRFLRLLGVVDEPEELLAITFTRKAASEMRERVLQALEGELRAPGAIGQLWESLRAAALSHAAARGWSLADLPARLRIQTIDSLNHEIARAMPVLGRLQGSLQVVDDASSLHREAARQTLRAIDADPAMQRDADTLLGRLDNNWSRAEELLSSLLSDRARWLPVLVGEGPAQLAEAVERSLRRIAEETLADALGLPPELLDEGAALARASAGNRQRAGVEAGAWNLWLSEETSLDADPQSLPVWRSLVDLLLTNGPQGTLRKVIDKNSGFPANDKPLKNRWIEWREAFSRIANVEERLRGLRNLPDPDLGEGEREAMAALARILIHATGELKLVFRDRGRVDHAEVAAVARQALSEQGMPTDQAIHQTLRIQHLLVDEFQDVSPDQVDLIQSLTSGWSAGDGRSLFLVGDPMQSIYLFRNSEVGLFLRTRAHGIGEVQLEPLQLTSNFRSQAPLVDWANEVFRSTFPQQENLRASAVAFLASLAARAQGATSGPAITVLPMVEHDPQQEAEWIAQQILQLRAEASARRIAILVRDRPSAPPILLALQAAHISVRGVDLASLAQRQVVRDLAAIGAALLHAGDRSAWLAVLRSPCCGLLLADLKALCGDDLEVPVVERLGDVTAIARLSADGQLRLARCAPILVDAFGQRQRQDLAIEIERLWVRLGGAATVDAGERSAAEQYLSALRSLEADDPRPDAATLLSLARRLRDKEVGPPRGEGEFPPVEMLTIHHSKGLEWDVVFLPGLGRPSRVDSAPLMRWLELPAEDGQRDLLMSVHSIGERSESDPLSRYIARLQEERQRNERTRLAYVAITRARERLLLSGHAKPGAEGEPRPESRSLLGILWPALGPHFDVAVNESGAPAPAAPLHGGVWRRVTADFDTAAGRTSLPRPDGVSMSAEASASRPEFEWVGPAARAAGTVIHGALEQLARDANWPSIDTPARIAGFERQLRQLGVDAVEAVSTSRDIAARLRHLSRDPLAQWLLSPAHRDARSEWRLSGPVQGAVRNIVIDRTFVDEGVRWVIDYKTSTHGGGGLDTFLENELERYRPQLQMYVQLASRLGPERVKAALYFPWLGILKELPT